jgi:predicted nucleic acid-binding protein
MNAMIDTNIILDDILNRMPNAETALRISRLITDGHVTGYVTANCLTDIFYVVSKSINAATAKKTIRNLLLSFAVVSVDGQDCQKAIDSFMQDFEDALVVVCAEKTNLNYIVTNDKSFLGRTDLSVPAISPADFLLRFEA